MSTSAQQAENANVDQKRRGPWYSFPYAWITGAFLVSRAIYFLAGIRFDTHILAGNFQFIDLQLLRSRMFESLFYFHMQPPLMNLLVGSAVKVFPGHYGAALHVLYIAVGLSSGILLYQVMRYLEVSQEISTVLTILFISSPAAAIYENFPMYEYLMMGLLLASSLALYNLILHPNFQWSCAFFSFLAALAWIRSLYHIVYLVAIAVAVECYLPKQRKAILVPAALAISTVLALFLKNLFVFGLFSSSSWLGHALLTCTIHQLSDTEKTSLIQQGKLSEIATVESGAPVSAYRRFFPDVKATGIPVLDQEIKSTGGLNTNNVLYLKADFAYRQAARQVLRYYPIAYVRSVVIAWFTYFLPPSDFFQFEEARAHIRSVDRLYNIIIFGQFHEATGKQLRVLRSEGRTISLLLYTGTFLVIGFPVLLAIGVIHLTQGIHHRTLPPARVWLLSFVIVNIMYVIATANFLSSFENNRYAFPTLPLYVVLLGLGVQRVSVVLRRRHHPSNV
jgi:hypothetical protein